MSGSEPRGLQLEGREIGRCRGAQPGATLLAVAGMHGNEPAGIEAARRVLAQLERGAPALRGEFTALAGNLGALRLGVRYQAQDLNRLWSEQRLSRLQAQGEEAGGAEGGGPESAPSPEEGELVGLCAAIEEARARARGPARFVDLHTTSAEGVPFLLGPDSPAQRRFLRAFPLTFLLGLEQRVPGVSTAFWAARGWTSFSVEGGQHRAPGAVDALEAVLWLALAASGQIDAEGPQAASAFALLDRLRGGLPQTVEVLSRHAIGPEDGFRMEPGFRNIDWARQGQLLAHDRHGEIRAASDGLVVMPLYQGLGGEGFFWARPVDHAADRSAGHSK